MHEKKWYSIDVAIPITNHEPVKVYEANHKTAWDLLRTVR